MRVNELSVWEVQQTVTNDVRPNCCFMIMFLVHYEVLQKCTMFNISSNGTLTRLQ